MAKCSRQISGKGNSSGIESGLSAPIIPVAVCVSLSEKNNRVTIWKDPLNLD